MFLQAQPYPASNVLMIDVKKTLIWFAKYFILKHSCVYTSHMVISNTRNLKTQSSGVVFYSELKVKYFQVRLHLPHFPYDLNAADFVWS